jgi:hypothetical protein
VADGVVAVDHGDLFPGLPVELAGLTALVVLDREEVVGAAFVQVGGMGVLGVEGVLCRCLDYADAKTIVAGHRGARAECIGIVVELPEVSAASGQTDEHERFGELAALTSPPDSNP